MCASISEAHGTKINLVVLYLFELHHSGLYWK